MAVRRATLRCLSVLYFLRLTVTASNALVTRDLASSAAAAASVLPSVVAGTAAAWLLLAAAFVVATALTATRGAAAQVTRAAVPAPLLCAAAALLGRLSAGGWSGGSHGPHSLQGSSAALLLGTLLLAISLPFPLVAAAARFAPWFARTGHAARNSRLGRSSLCAALLGAEPLRVEPAAAAAAGAGSGGREPGEAVAAPSLALDDGSPGRVSGAALSSHALSTTGSVPGSASPSSPPARPASAAPAAPAFPASFASAPSPPHRPRPASRRGARRRSTSADSGRGRGGGSPDKRGGGFGGAPPSFLDASSSDDPPLFVPSPRRRRASPPAPAGRRPRAASVPKLRRARTTTELAPSAAARRADATHPLPTPPPPPPHEPAAALQLPSLPRPAAAAGVARSTVVSPARLAPLTLRGSLDAPRGARPAPDVSDQAITYRWIGSHPAFVGGGASAAPRTSVTSFGRAPRMSRHSADGALASGGSGGGGGSTVGPLRLSEEVARREEAAMARLHGGGAGGAATGGGGGSDGQHGGGGGVAVDAFLALPALPSRGTDDELFAEHHPNVSITFCDVVGFTTLCETSTPVAVMKMLHALFSHLDELCELCGLYKVETIGDAYMACGGLFDAPASPTASSSASAASSTGPSLSSSHAPASLLFSLLAHQAAAELGLRLRVGIHCGPVTSGLVGSVRARFCLFGDVVNTASRMESTSVAGAVHVSAAAWALADLPDRLATRRTVPLKGKAAPMDTMLLHASSAFGAEAKATLLARWPQSSSASPRGGGGGGGSSVEARTLAIQRSLDAKGADRVPIETLLRSSQSATTAEVKGILLSRSPRSKGAAGGGGSGRSGAESPPPSLML